MSNSLNRRLRGKTIKIFGPPGTGKTENLLKRVQRYLKKGYSPDEICYVSFTNKAVNECVARVRKDLKNMMKMISNIFERYILWPDNSLLRFPF